MRKMKIVMGYLLAMGLLLQGCYEQSAQVDLPTYNKRTAIKCYLSPKDPNITVELTFTLPYFGPQSQQIPRVGDAKVELSDVNTGKSVVLPFDSSVMLYRVKAFALPIVNEHEYRLDVTMKDGTLHSSKTTIPKALKEEDLKLGSFNIGKLQDTDFGGQEISINLELLSANSRTGYFYSPQFDLVMEDRNGDFYGNTMYFSGMGIEEGKTNDTLRYLYNDRIFIQSPMGGLAADPMILKEVVGTYWVMDQGYKENYLREMSISDNPFAEPVLVYSNWSNGAIGAFGSYDWLEMLLTP